MTVQFVGLSRHTLPGLDRPIGDCGEKLEFSNVFFSGVEVFLLRIETTGVADTSGSACRPWVGSCNGLSCGEKKVAARHGT
jgi:hypothetical protein